MTSPTDTSRCSSSLGATPDGRGLPKPCPSLSSHSSARGSADEAAPGKSTTPGRSQVSRARRCFQRECEVAHMIATTPPGVWPQHTVAIANAVLRSHPGWNVIHMEDAR